MERTNDLEQICLTDLTHVTTAEQVNKALNELNAAKKTMLESSVYALQEGDSLLDQLNNMWTQSSLDSRPESIRRSVNLSIEKVRARCCRNAAIF